MCVKEKDYPMSTSNVMSSPITRAYVSFVSSGASNAIRMLCEEESKIAKNEEIRNPHDGLPAIARLALNYGCGINRDSYLFIK